jgi:hypothetical protein
MGISGKQHVNMLRSHAFWHDSCPIMNSRNLLQYIIFKTGNGIYIYIYIYIYVCMYVYIYSKGIQNGSRCMNEKL